MKLKYFDTYRQWIQKIECQYPAKIWKAELLPAHKVEAPTFERLAELIEEHCTNEVIQLCADALRLDPDLVFDKTNGKQPHLADGRQATAIVCKRKFKGANHQRMAEKIGWVRHCMVTHSVKNYQVREIAEKVNAIYSKYPFLKDYETPIN